MADDTKTPNNTKALEMAADVRKFEIGLFWQRSLVFWGFIAAAFVAYAALAKEPDKDLSLRSPALGLCVVRRGHW